MFKRFVTAFLISWFYSLVLSIFFTVRISEHHSFADLLLPGVFPVAVLGCTIYAILITPIAFWAMRTGIDNLIAYGCGLLALLVIYIIWGLPLAGSLGLQGPWLFNSTFVLAVIGLLIVGLIPE